MAMSLIFNEVSPHACRDDIANIKKKPPVRKLRGGRKFNREAGVKTPDQKHRRFGGKPVFLVKPEDGVGKNP
ncbi:hypothetical protein TH8_15640 [Thalassospira profundimaris]|jgi:hypothetical protein|nr:hypothetical protein AUQ42_07415 [Thalassospira sp. MCCC 1A02491]MAL41235.1 hypothetical protein [Thalassospira sp.]RCK22761.1 hypothetical protein TH8_15640 [Thalassospira profundimaris]HAY48806.1 hypothetical protein [Thalassospira sp.]|tara:strand:- start:186 stop:401 length:216 start_codon:yes stop_codon:yes gene_type:complete